MEAARKQRSTLKGRVTRTRNKIQTSVPSVFVAKEYLENLNNFKEELKVLQKTILDECSNDDIEKEEDYYEVVATDIGELKAILSEIIAADSAASVKSDDINVSSGIPVSKPLIKLPRVQIPTFDGSIEKWASFKDLFSELVHKNNDLQPVQKFQYLKTSLVEEAASLIQHLPLTSANYYNAWTILIDTFSNKYSTVSYHLKNIFNIEYESSNRVVSLKSILTAVRTNLNALESLGIDIKSWDIIIIYLLESKIDAHLFQEWVKKFDNKKMPTLNMFYDFLTEMIIIAERSQQKTMPRNKSTTLFRETSECSLCKLCHHKLYECVQFKNLALKERLAHVNKNNICFNCISTVCTQMENSCKEHVLLSTAVVRIKDAEGKYQFVRALLDSGSQSCFISTECVKKLKLKENTMNPINVNGIGGSNSLNVSKFCEFSVESRYEKFNLLIKALVVPKVTNKLPAISLNKLCWDYTENINLSDPNFSSSHDIDMIIGAEHFFSILKNGFIQGPAGYPNIQNSKFGWIVAGKVANTSTSNISTFHVNLDTTMKRFWEVEELPITQHLSQEERECEEHFAQNVKRVNDGKYMVKLPFKNNIQDLGESKNKVIARFRSVEKNLSQSPSKKELYGDFMKEYQELGHMSLVSDSIDPTESLPHYYLPHHSVFRESSNTTRLRVVFDGSAKSSPGVSINDTLMIGPLLQQNIFSILLRFRKHKVVLKADCEKMYRQIWIHPNDRKYQKIIWYKDENVSKLAEYELNTLTYGTSCAPYIAVRCLMQLAIDEKTRYPIAAKITEQDFFMDDLVTGANSVEEAIEIHNNLVEMFRSAGFNLRKWSSNKTAVLDEIPEESRDVKGEWNCEENGQMVKTLGLCWNMHKDTLFFKVNEADTGNNLSKRIILSEIARYYDPLGLLSPVIILAKIKIQKLWLANLNWDDEIIGDFASSWRIFQSHLHCINNI